MLESNPEQENPDPQVLDRFPPEDHEDVPFTENAEFVRLCLCTLRLVLFTRGSTY